MSARHVGPGGGESWPEDEIAALKRHAAAGLSCTDIALALATDGFTATRSRNAVLGKLHRLGVPLLGTSASKVREAKDKGTVARKRGARTVKVAKPTRALALPAPSRAARAAPAPKARDGLPEPQALLVGLPVCELVEKLTDAICKWPDGDVREPGFSFCGHPVWRPTSKDGYTGPYCEHHARRAGDRGQPPPSSVYGFRAAR